jgi:hypothetical protein
MKLIKMFLCGCVFSSLIIGCDYIPNTHYELSLSDGSSITMSCPELDEGRSRYTYLYDRDCFVVKEKE